MQLPKCTWHHDSYEKPNKDKRVGNWSSHLLGGDKEAMSTPSPAPWRGKNAWWGLPLGDSISEFAHTSLSSVYFCSINSLYFPTSVSPLNYFLSGEKTLVTTALGWVLSWYPSEPLVTSWPLLICKDRKLSFEVHLSSWLQWFLNL